MGGDGGPTAEASRGPGRRDRRQDLLAAAARRFVADGIHAATMEDIAREAGAGKATLYRHFANKDAVIDALLEREAERFARQVAAAADEHRRSTDRLEAAFLAGVRFFLEHPVLLRGRDEPPGVLLDRITANRGPLVSRGLDVLARVVEEGVAKGELRAVAPRQAAEVLMRLILSYFSLPPMEVRVEDPDEAQAFARTLIAASLAAR